MKNGIVLFVLALLTVLVLVFIKVKIIDKPVEIITETTTETPENKVLQAIHERRSVRNFTDSMVNKAELDVLMRAGMAAPTAVNLQPWAFIGITDRAILDTLGSVLPYAKMLYKAQAAIVVCGDLYKAGELADKGFWIQDCSAASENILLAAQAIGLGAVWTAVYPDTQRIAAVKTILEIPENIIPFNVIPIGYPAANSEKPKDKYNEDNVHWDTW